jgi:hypothetical protein
MTSPLFSFFLLYDSSLQLPTASGLVSTHITVRSRVQFARVIKFAERDTTSTYIAS